jgi:hypothetical protein
MSGKANQERKEYWKDKITKWKSSGKTGFSWCKDNNICAKSFYRWRSFFSNGEKSINFEKKSFIELSNNKSQFHLEIEYKKYKFTLSEFTFIELQELIKLLKVL